MTSNRFRALGLAAVIAACVMDLLDSTVVQLAAPAIRAELGGSYSSLQWMTAGYTMAMAVALLVGGRLGDMFGRRRVLLAGVAGFTLASVACGLAWAPEALIGARVLQGLFGAVMLPQTFGLIRELFGPNDMAKVWGVFGPVMGLSALLGPILAGVIIDADVFGTGWRMIFLLNVPVGLFSLLAGLRFLPKSAPTMRGARLDGLGVLVAAAGTFLLVFPLVQGRELGWPMWTKLSLLVALPVLAGFGWYQVARKRAGRVTLVEPGTFKNRSYTFGVVLAVVFTAAMGGTMLLLSVLMQLGLGFSPLRASLSSLPWALGTVVGTMLSGQLMARFGRKLLHVGFAVMAAGLVSLLVVFKLVGAEMGGWDFVLPTVLGGIGMGMIFGPLFDIITAKVTDEQVGSASGVLQSVQQLGMSLGIAVLGTVYFGHAADRAAAGAGHREAFLDAAQLTGVITVAMLALAFGLAFLLPRKARQHAAPATEEVVEEERELVAV
ncbi:putative actinorhodin transporter [Actinorhabdospora filicis]|uniref:Actinorhodin transporter n=1 Tax=Actinorhabdospora filicis TaxID=1785913 RepID=A0A9W6SEL6_9ACTN|nr:MFS transporter [Actinorhabdospora filicis]GLZ75790.1 putative actinorhodin transporter [Actinorhabdospora filicis]